MKRLLTLLLAFQGLVALAGGGTPVTFDNACTSGIYNIPLNECLEDSVGGGGGSPGGANTDVQFNSSGSFGGDSGLTYTSGSQLTLTGSSNTGTEYLVQNTGTSTGDDAHVRLQVQNGGGDPHLWFSVQGVSADTWAVGVHQAVSGAFRISNSSQPGTSDMLTIAPTTGVVNLSSLTASEPVFTDSSKNLVSLATVPLSNGGFGLPNTQTNFTTTGNIAAYTPTTTFNVYNTGSANATIQGMVNPGGNSRVVISNGTSASNIQLTISNENASATAANRFHLEGGQDLILVQGMTTEFIYNTTTSRWNVKEVRNQLANDSNGNLYTLLSNPLAGGATTNILIGKGAQIGVGAGSNIVLGYQAGGNSSGAFNYNDISGFQAGYNLTHVSGSDADDNVIHGSQAGYALTSGNSDTLLGPQAGYSATTESHSTFLGDGAGYFATAGSYNVALGAGAGASWGASSNETSNIAIGEASGFYAGYSGLSNTLAIGQQARVGQSDSGNISSPTNDFRLGINNSFPSYALDVVGYINTSAGFLIQGISQNPWTLVGNAGTSPGTNFVGTTDYQDVYISSYAFTATGLPNIDLKPTGLVGFNQNTPLATGHFGVVNGAVAAPTGLAASTGPIGNGYYAFGAGPKSYYVYGTALVSGTQIFSSGAATATYYEDATTSYDPYGFYSDSSQVSSGPGYDTSVVTTPPSYQIWALYESSDSQSIGTVTGPCDNGTWQNTGIVQCNIYWAAPPLGAGSLTGYYIYNSIYGAGQFVGNVTTFIDNTTGWSGGTTPGLPNISYSVNLFASNQPSVSNDRFLNTTTVTYVDSAVTTVDYGLWSSGSTVTPTSAQYASLQTDGPALFTSQTNETGITIATPTDNTQMDIVSQEGGGYDWSIDSSGGASGYGAGFLSFVNQGPYGSPSGGVVAMGIGPDNTVHIDSILQLPVQAPSVTPTCASIADNGKIALTSAHVLCGCNGTVPGWFDVVTGLSACTF